MPRIATPYVWRDWYVTKAGTNGTPHKLCHKDEGAERAAQELMKWLDQCRKRKVEAHEQGLVEADSPYTVAHLAAELVQLKEANKKPATVEHYRKNLERLVKWYGHLAADKVRLAHASEYISKLRKLGLSSTTINHHLQAAKTVFNYAVEADVLRKNPWRKAEQLPSGRRERVMTDEEFQKLIAACDGCIAYRGKVSREENATLMRDMLYILRYTAMRPGELRRLKWHHVRWEDDLIIIPAREQKTGSTAKEPEDRLIPVLAEAKAILARRKEKYGHQPVVFPNIMGKEWTDQLFSQRFARLRKRAGLDEPDHNGEMLVPYSLRHTRLSEAGVTEGWEFYTLMKFAGHTTPQMTKRYVHPGKNDLLRAARQGQKRREDAASN